MTPRSSRFVLTLLSVSSFLTACSSCSSKHDGVTLVVAFPDSAVVEPGSPVAMNGSNIGVVGEVTPGDGKLVVEILLNRDARITHAFAPVANHQSNTNDRGSVVAFLPIPVDELSVIYAEDTTIIDSPYIDGKYLAFGRVVDPRP